MKTLTESDVIRIMREEYDSIVSRIVEEFDLTAELDGEEKSLLSAELKVRHTKSGLRYTVDSVSPRDVVLRTPDGKRIMVGRDELEGSYEIA